MQVLALIEAAIKRGDDTQTQQLLASQSLRATYDTVRPACTLTSHACTLSPGCVCWNCSCCLHASLLRQLIPKSRECSCPSLGSTS